MEQIIAPVERELLKKELTPDRRLRRTNKRDNEIYVVTYQNAPNVVREIGRLREIAFREAGGGTGKAVSKRAYRPGAGPFGGTESQSPKGI